MELTLRRRNASRGWHVYGKTMWKEPKRGEFVFAEKELNEEALLYDTFSVAWKRKLTTKVNADVVGHLPREISRAVWFFITHGGSLTGKVHSPKYYPSPIAQRGLEILIDCEFKMDASKLILVERLQEIIDTNYKDPASLSVQPTIANTNELTQGQVEEVEDEDSDDEIQLMFTNDEGDEHEHDDASREENEENDVDFESH